MSPRLPSDLLGAHVSTAGGISRAPARAAALPARAFQVFTSNQNQWRARPQDEEEIAAWREALRGAGLRAEDACSHDSYLINLASPRPEVLARSRRAFVEEIHRCARLGLRNLVLHPGSHLGEGEAAGIAAVAANLDRCLEEAAGPDGVEAVRPCLEGTAGQGTNLGHRFEHLRDIIGASRHGDRLGVCLDTCHLFAAGYGLTTARQWRDTLAEFDRVVGLDRLRVVHLNDSKRGFGSRVDRHARLGEGEIGLDALVRVVRAPELRGVPIVLETPGGEEAYAEDLARLRRRLRAADRAGA